MKSVIVLLFLLFCNTVLAKPNKVDNFTCDIVRGQALTSGSFGPYSYIEPTHQKYRPIVENVHFTRDVETLRAGASTVKPQDDLAYTLRKFPNHHRALYSMIRIQTEQTKWLPIDFNSIYSMDCYFKRAFYFESNDPTLFALQGIYFHKVGNYDSSEKAYLKSIAMAPNNAEFNYNLGLMYFDADRLEESKKYAEKAYKMGFPLQGLMKKLANKEISLDIK